MSGFRQDCKIRPRSEIVRARPARPARVQPGPAGEPAAPPLGVGAIASADAVLVPALAVAAAEGDLATLKKRQSIEDQLLDRETSLVNAISGAVNVTLTPLTGLPPASCPPGKETMASLPSSSTKPLDLICASS